MESKSTADASITFRVDALERIVHAQGSEYTEMKIQMARLDEAIKGIREQARMHNESHTKGMVALQEKFDVGIKKVETLVANTGKELQETLDKIITTIGIDEDPKAANGLRDNLKFLNDLKLSREETVTWTRRGIIALLLGGIGSLLVAGAIRIVGGGQ